MEGLVIVREAFPRTVRLVSTARLRAPVLQALVSAQEVETLAEIEGATSARLIAQDRGTEGVGKNEFVHGIPSAAFINAAFAYAKPRQPNRFNAARGAWYSALEVKTSMRSRRAASTGSNGPGAPSRRSSPCPGSYSARCGFRFEPTGRSSSCFGRFCRNETSGADGERPAGYAFGGTACRVAPIFRLNASASNWALMATVWSSRGSWHWTSARDAPSRSIAPLKTP